VIVTVRVQALSLVLVLAGAGLFLASCGQGRGAAARDLALTGQALWTGDLGIVGLDAGRDEPGGTERLWMAEAKGIHLLATDGSATVAWKPPRFARIIRFEAADLDGDGVDEWVVVMDQGRIRSVVVELRDGQRQTRGKPWNGFLRPVVGADGGVTLAGQRAGGDAPFRGPVIGVQREEKGWVAGEQVGLPPGVSVFDYAWLPEGPERPARLFSFAEGGFMEERDARSPRAIVWRSDDRFVSRPVELDREYRNMLGEQEGTTLRLAPPVSIVDEDEDGAPELLMVGGTQTPVVVFENLRVYQGGDARLLTPTSRGVEETRRSPLLGRAMVAVTPWSPVAGERVWAAAVWTRMSSGFVRPESRVFLLDPATGDLVGAR
jgi:hypothetical protein